MKISAIILAAGQSHRMGKPKVLMPVQGEPMILKSVKLAIESELSPIYIISGAYHNEIKAQLGQYPVKTIYNKNYFNGMSTSLKLGIDKVRGHCDGTIIFLADQPFVPVKVVGDIIQEYSRNVNNHIKVIRPIFNEKPGHPILFDSSLFDEFNLLKGDVGGKSLISNNRDYLSTIPYSSTKWGVDIDTLEEYERYME